MKNIIDKSEKLNISLLLISLVCFVINLFTPIGTIVFYPFIGLGASLMLNLILNSLSFIIDGIRNKSKWAVFLGIFFLVFPWISPIAIIIGFSFGNNCLIIVGCLSFLLAIPSLFLADLKLTRKNYHFKMAYFFLVIILPSVLFIISPSSSPATSHIDAKAKATMNQMRVTAELYKIVNEKTDYEGLQSDSEMVALIAVVNDVIEGNNAIVLSPDSLQWCFKVELKTHPNFWCVDSNGYEGAPIDEAGRCNENNGNYSCN